MTDVEELLRETLADSRYRLDPGPAMYEAVRERARSRRRRQAALASAAAAAVAVVVAGSVIGVQQTSSHHATPLSTPTSGPTGGATSTPSVPPLPPQGTTGKPIDLGAAYGTVYGVLTNGEALYALTGLGETTTVVALSPDGSQVKVTAPGPRGVPTGLVVGDGRVWAWSQEGRSLRAYDSHTLKPLGEFTTEYQIFNAAALDGKLYVSTSSGLYYSDYSAEGSSLSAPATKVPGIAAAYGLAADPARHRIIVGAFNGSAGGVQIDAVDTRTGKVSKGAQTTLGKESIAVAGDEVWVGGYASEGPGRTQRLVHLDAKTLQVMGSSPLSDLLGPGAVVWPGQHVLWAGSGGDGNVSCVNPETGAVLAQYGSARGPVTSVGSSAYALSGGNLVPLELAGGCSG